MLLQSNQLFKYIYILYILKQDSPIKMFIGGCSECTKSCVESNKANFHNNHTGSHDIFNKSEVINCMKNHIEIIAGKACQRKIENLNKFFKQLSKKIEQIKYRKIEQLIRIKTQVAFSIGQNKNTRDYCKYVDDCINGRLEDLKCRNAGFLMRGLHKMDKNAKSGERIDYQLFNKVIKTARNQIDNNLRSLQSFYITDLQKIDQELRKQFNMLLAQKKLTNNVPQRIEKADYLKQTKTTIVEKQQERSQNHHLLKKKITLVKQAPEKTQFTIRVKIQKIQNVISGKRGEKILFLGRDSSGIQQLAFRTHQYIAEGNQVIIQRCKVEDIHGKKKIVSIYESDICLVKRPNGKIQQRQDRRHDRRDDRRQDRRDDRRQMNFHQNERNRNQRNNNKDRDRRSKSTINRGLSNFRRDRGQRDDDFRRKRQQTETRDQRRPMRRNNQQKQQKTQTKKVQKTMKQTFRKQQQEQSYEKIQDINPLSQNITIQVKIHQIRMQIKQNLLCVIGDQTGIVQAQLPAKYDCVIESGSVIIKGAYAQVRNEHIIMIVKQNSKLKRSLKSFNKIRIGNNISASNWIQDNN